MYEGAHWFSDVIGAALLAGIYLALAWKLDGMISHIRETSDERELAVDAGLSVALPSQPRFARTPRRGEPAVLAAAELVREREPAARV